MKAYSTHNPILVLSLAAIAGLAPALAVRAEPESPALAGASSEMLPPESATASAIDRQLLNAATDFSSSDAAVESQQTLFAQTEPLAPVNPVESPTAEAQPAPEAPGSAGGGLRDAQLELDGLLEEVAVATARAAVAEAPVEVPAGRGRGELVGSHRRGALRGDQWRQCQGGD